MAAHVFVIMLPDVTISVTDCHKLAASVKPGIQVAFWYYDTLVAKRSTCIWALMVCMLVDICGIQFCKELKQSG